MFNVHFCFPFGGECCKLAWLSEGSRCAFLQCYPCASGTGHLGAAVAMVSGALAKGVIRMVQLDSETCVFEGTVDGLASRAHDIAIHEAGDLSAGCDRFVLQTNSFAHDFRIISFAQGCLNLSSFCSCGDVFDFNDGRESQVCDSLSC